MSTEHCTDLTTLQGVAIRSQFVPVDDPVTLSNCDREPIHTPGAIQAHGALFAIDPSTYRVLAASGNAAEFTDVPIERTVNARAEDVFSREQVERLRAVASERVATSDAVILLDFYPGLPGRVTLAHETLYLELEPAGDVSNEFVTAIRSALVAFDALDSIDTLCDGGARRLRDLTGYDRVMVYRFDPDGHGSVVAEAREPHLDAFLGQHYPASDIPRQARELYRTTIVRLIVDVDYRPTPVDPPTDPRTDQPWDLGRANLRSVSPIHIQYLKNMGVTATLTISLLRAGELWGLIACHHYSPKFAGYAVRATAESIGRGLIARIASLEDATLARERESIRAAVVELASGDGPDRFAAAVNSGRVREALRLGGSALVIGDRIQAIGNVPDAERMHELIAWLSEREGSAVFVTDRLAKLNEAFAEIASVASGVYAYRTSEAWYFAFRGEYVHEIKWGGDPEKAASLTNDRLTPRGSFETWREEVRERAIPWEPAVLEGLDDIARWAKGSRWI